MIEHIALHIVGNKEEEEPIILSEKELHVSEVISEVLQGWLLLPFQTDDYYQLYNDSGIEYL